MPRITPQRSRAIASDCRNLFYHYKIMFEPPPETKWNVLSLGAGVQSSCLALMASRGEIGPMPDFAVFADTQAEPQSVYDWLEWLEGELPFPVHKVTKGSLTEDSLQVRVATKRSKKGEGNTYIKRMIPTFGKMPNGDVVGAMGRMCTADYKIQPIFKKIKELCGVKRGQKEANVTQWVGISLDEVQRMKEPRVKWTQNRWPLIEKRMTRHDCHQWMMASGYPTPPRSACVYCPFHSDSEWRRLRDDEPEEFQRAIRFDHDLRKAFKEHDDTTIMTAYLHRSCKPLGEVDFDSDEDKGQQVWDFQAECEGMCGI